MIGENECRDDGDNDAVQKMGRPGESIGEADDEGDSRVDHNVILCVRL